jgi:glutathione S-transferase
MPGLGASCFRKVIHPIFHQQIVAPNIQKIASDQSLINTALQNALGAFSYVEGSSLVGEHASLSIADLSVISNLVMFHYLGHRIDRARFPALSRYFQRSIAMPFFREILSAERPFAENMGLDLTYLPGN